MAGQPPPRRRDLSRHWTKPVAARDRRVDCSGVRPTRSQAMRDALQLSDALVDEILEADSIVAGIPFYNFGMPSGFKAYIDQIVRVGRTFSFHPDNGEATYLPLVHDKRMIAVISRGDGGYGPGGRNEALNHLDPHLRTVLRFIGVNDLEIVAAENDEHGGAALVDSLESARNRLTKLAGIASETVGRSQPIQNPPNPLPALGSKPTTSHLLCSAGDC